MGLGSGRLDDWRNIFGNSDIFDVIENGILIAASDCPAEFCKRRTRIAEMLFSCRTAQCIGCNHVELHVPAQEGTVVEFRRELEGGVNDEGGERETKADSSTSDVAAMVGEASNYTYDEAEALTEEIEEESQTIGEVFRIKGILLNKNDESDSVLFESLRRLQLMELPVETLKATEIGKAVNGLRKHNSKQICCLVRTLIYGWKVLVDEWVSAAPVLEEATPESMNPSRYGSDSNGGLLSPPLDEGAFLATQTTSIEFSKFFEGVDDDGNPQAIREFNKNEISRWCPRPDNKKNKTANQLRYPSCFSEEKVSTRAHGASIKQENVIPEKQSKVQESIIMSSTPPDSFCKLPKLNEYNSPSSYSRTERNPNLSNDCKSKYMKSQQKLIPAGIQKRPLNDIKDKSKNSDDNLVQAKLELAKRKLQERYQEAENTKKQRTIQVMELNDLPKQALNHKHFPPKQRKFTRHWSNGRH